jgi:hypothetical protein
MCLHNSSHCLLEGEVVANGCHQLPVFYASRVHLTQTPIRLRICHSYSELQATQTYFIEANSGLPTLDIIGSIYVNSMSGRMVGQHMKLQRLYQDFLHKLAYIILHLRESLVYRLA